MDKLWIIMDKINNSLKDLLFVNVFKNLWEEIKKIIKTQVFGGKELKPIPIRVTPNRPIQNKNNN